jgi:broad specificity phosphatase PhoE
MQHTLYFFRHGESVTNAGHATPDAASIALTPKGEAQARALGRFFPPVPHAVHASPFARARRTAELALEGLPGTTIKLSPIHEFVYLSPITFANTTTKERQPWVDAYWRKADPLHRDGPEAETYAELVERVDATLAWMRALLRESPVTAVFGHGMFMNALLTRAKNEGRKVTGEDMRACRERSMRSPIANGTGFRCELDPGGSLRFFDAR